MLKLVLVLFFSTLAVAKSPKPEVLLSQDDVIWGFDFLKDGKVVFTERGGKLFVFDPKTKKAVNITGVPKVHAVGQGGLLDVRVHPKNGYIYFTYSEPVGDKSTTSLGRGKIEGNKLVGFQKLFAASPASENDHHYGSRIEFVADKVFITVGERGERKLVQKMDNQIGKVIRMNEDGSSAEIYARGIRSPQGLALRPGTSELWEAEMGPRGGDELNIIEENKDYGWPVITYGREYYGPKIGEGNSKKGVEEPVVYWVPSISPSGMAFHKGFIYLGTLSGEHLHKLTLDGKKVTKQEEFYKDLSWRWRNVRSGPDGKLWFSTDEGKLGHVDL